MATPAPVSPPATSVLPAAGTVRVIRDRAALAHCLAGERDCGGLPPQVDLAGWLALAGEADEASFRQAQQLGLPLVELDALPIAAEAVARLPPEMARRLRAVPLDMESGRIAVAVADAGDHDVLKTLGFLLAEHVLPVVASGKAIREAIARLYDRGEDEAMARQLGIDPLLAGQAPVAREIERLASEKPVVRVVADLIAEAVARRASDLHLRPGPHGLDVFYRIDDELVPVRRFIRSVQSAVVCRLKVLGAMNLAEHRRPQDGRTSFALDDGRNIDLRISVLPAVHGESVVVRLLDPRQSLWNIDQLGLSEPDRVRLDDVLARSHGLFLVTGPTGCGKSTTLYAMLMRLRQERINILTIEDPVEIYLEDVQQMQVNRAVDFTFAAALRNFLRHDPDVIMVGEIRDAETAGIAIESALTGHLVLSTLHTNTAATTIIRLLDLGVGSYLLRASLLAVMSQRLVRLTCAHCREVEPADAHVRGRLGVDAADVFYRGRGCSHCEGLGVHGRQAVYELMVASPRLQALIVEGAEAEHLHAVAVEEGMTSITQAAVAMARAGKISLAEAWRVRAD